MKITEHFRKIYYTTFFVCIVLEYIVNITGLKESILLYGLNALVLYTVLWASTSFGTAYISTRLYENIKRRLHAYGNRYTPVRVVEDNPISWCKDCMNWYKYSEQCPAKPLTND